MAKFLRDTLDSKQQAAVPAGRAAVTVIVDGKVLEFDLQDAYDEKGMAIDKEASIMLILPMVRSALANVKEPFKNLQVAVDFNRSS